MNTLLHDRSGLIGPRDIVISKPLRAVALLVLLAVTAISVNVAVILADGKFRTSPVVGPAAFVGLNNGGRA